MPTIRIRWWAGNAAPGLGTLYWGLWSIGQRAWGIGKKTNFQFPIPNPLYATSTVS
ncbi:MAG: hypothetical protein HXY43_21765 [Fischerella sp.]|uniref:hypothetical protein n=1 Tax=Fischerella sp. TaxID=1191 RepID=UPI00183820B8|nr:hypothetical protein [Fischerella sp.]NWF61810.1 hypothetical protein [Fischerella sp.]